MEDWHGALSYLLLRVLRTSHTRSFHNIFCSSGVVAKHVHISYVFRLEASFWIFVRVVFLLGIRLTDVCL